MESTLPTFWGILNITPDSFSDGDPNFREKNYLERALAIVKDGAAVLDIGGESTRPGAEPIDAVEEMDRILPVLEGLKGRIHAPISIDTYKPEVAEVALCHGASIVNDITGLAGSNGNRMAELVAGRGAKLVIVYRAREKRDGINVLNDAMQFFKRAFKIATHHSIAARNLFFDPGIGFNKTFEQNVELLQRIDILLGHFPEIPFLVGISRKSFLGKIAAETEAKNRDLISALLAWKLFKRGIFHWRIHDVALHRRLFSESFQLDNIFG